ncbi:hypothetical protein [Microbacterium resistens]|uniref:hypothetical protein n=1 Tax=Microbacterium resistens TaxID=156977 RepID=UPI00366E6D3F
MTAAGGTRDPADDPAGVASGARRRAAGGFVVGVLVLGVAVVAFAGWSGGIAIRATALVSAVIGVLTLIVAGLARTIARRYPDVAAISGPNLLAGLLGGAVAGVGAVLCLLDATRLTLGLVLAALMLVLGIQLAVYVRANHRDVRRSRDADPRA